MNYFHSVNTNRCNCISRLRISILLLLLTMTENIVNMLVPKEVYKKVPRIGLYNELKSLIRLVTKEKQAN